MVLAIEMGVVFVLLTAILMALYVAWQNAKFVGDRLRKKQVMKRLVAGGAAIVLAVAVAIGAVVTAYAATSDTDTKQTGQAEAAAGDYDTSTAYLWGSDDFLTLPNAEEKKGYLFRGYSVNGDTKLVQAGETVKLENGEKVTVRPIYTTTKWDCMLWMFFGFLCICFILWYVLLSVLKKEPSKKCVFKVAVVMCSVLLVCAFVVGIIENNILAEAIASIS